MFSSIDTKSHNIRITEYFPKTNFNKKQSIMFFINEIFDEKVNIKNNQTIDELNNFLFFPNTNLFVFAFTTVAVIIRPQQIQFIK